MRICMKPVRPGHDDLIGPLETVPTGSSQWERDVVGDTDYYANWLRRGQVKPDMFQSTLEISHQVKPSTAIDDINFHYLLSEVPTAGHAFYIDYSYCLIPIGATVPAKSSWVTGAHHVTFDGTEFANTYYYTSFVTDIPVPVSNTYSSLLLICASRRGSGLDTYTGNVAVIHLGAHAKHTQFGSVHVNSD